MADPEPLVDELLTAGDASADVPAALATALGLGIGLFVLAPVAAFGNALPPVAGAALLTGALLAGLGQRLPGRARDLSFGLAVAGLGPALLLVAVTVRDGALVDASVAVLGILAVVGAATPGLAGRSPIVGFLVAPATPLGPLLAVALFGGPAGTGPVSATLAAAGFVPVSVAFGFVGVAVAVGGRYAHRRFADQQT